MAAADQHALYSDSAADEGMEDSESEKITHIQETYEEMESTTNENADSSEMGNGGKFTL